MGIKLTKDSRFDVIYNGTEYMDRKNLTLQELSKFLGECEYMFGRKWEPIYLGNRTSKMTLPEFYHIVYTFKKHNYLVCNPGEIDKTLFRHELIGESSVIKEMESSNYRKKQEKKREKDRRDL